MTKLSPRRPPPPNRASDPTPAAHATPAPKPKDLP